MEMCYIFNKHNITFHCYADDVQIYVPLQTRSSAETLVTCLQEVHDWLKNNFLCLNMDKTEVIVFGESPFLNGVDSTIGPLDAYTKSSARNLGFIFDSDFKFEKQISAVVKSGFYHLKLLKPQSSFLGYL